MKEGLLYRYYEDATREHAYYRLLIPQRYQQSMIEGSHERGIACHQGYRRTFENLRLCYDWHDMQSQLRVYTRACAVCQRKRTRNVNTRHQMIGYLAGYVNERVNMDACGSFVTTPLKKQIPPGHLRHVFEICSSSSGPGHMCYDSLRCFHS